MSGSTSNPPIPIGDLLQNVLDEIFEGFQVIDKDWKYLYVNETVAKQGKKKKDELLGKTMMECYPGIEKTPVFEQLKKSMTDKISIRMENEFIFPDGSKGWFQLFIHPWDQGVLIFSIDITDRKEKEEQLHANIKELNKMMELSISRELRMMELKQIVARLQKPTSDGPVIMHN